MFYQSLNTTISYDQDTFDLIDFTLAANDAGAPARGLKSKIPPPTAANKKEPAHTKKTGCPPVVSNARRRHPEQKKPAHTTKRTGRPPVGSKQKKCPEAKKAFTCLFLLTKKTKRYLVYSSYRILLGKKKEYLGNTAIFPPVGDASPTCTHRVRITVRAIVNTLPQEKEYIVD